MIKIRETEIFADWIESLKDKKTRSKILSKIDLLALGSTGNIEPIGKGISELKINYGAGYRVYFVQKGNTLIILLCGGDKSSQKRDIRQAKEIVKNL